MEDVILACHFGVAGIAAIGALAVRREAVGGGRIDKARIAPAAGFRKSLAVLLDEEDVLQDIFFIEKDSKRFPKTSGWGYARFVYAPATDSFTPDGKGADCGYACHTKVASKDYIFHPYQKR